MAERLKDKYSIEEVKFTVGNKWAGYTQVWYYGVIDHETGYEYQVPREKALRPSDDPIVQMVRDWLREGDSEYERIKHLCEETGVSLHTMVTQIAEHRRRNPSE